jgi:competence protein ComEC
VSLKAIVLYGFFFAMVFLNTVPEKQDTQMVIRNIKEIDLNLQDDEAAFSFLELSSGESTLIQNSTGSTILLNTGAEEARHELKMHIEIFKIDTIDHLFITNFSEFHIGNLKWLIDEVDVKNIIVAAGMEQQVKKLLGDSSVKITPVQPGNKIVPFHDSVFHILYTGNNENNGALALSILYGKTTFLYMGISDESVEKWLVEKYDLNATQILKVGYFGSEEGTTQLFLEKVDPQVAIIFDKRDKMPSQDVMERLQSWWVDIFQPNNQGITLIKCTLDNYEVTIIPTREEKNIYK